MSVRQDTDGTLLAAVNAAPRALVFLTVPWSSPERNARVSFQTAAEQLATERAVTYSAEHLEDASGALAVFYASVVKDRDGWVFWGEDMPKETTRAGTEVQLTLKTQNGARYLVDFVIDSAEQQFAVVSGEARTTHAPALGHLALIVNGTGKEQKLRLLPLGDASFKSRRFTLFGVTVTPIS